MNGESLRLHEPEFTPALLQVLMKCIVIKLR